MNHSIIAATAAVFLALVAMRADAEPVVERYRPSLVFLSPVATTSGGAVIALRSGTGFVVSPEGYVLTNFHVITPPDKSIQYDKMDIQGSIGSRYERKYSLEIVRIDPEGDLVLLKLPWMGQEWKSLRVCREMPVDVDMDLLSLGFPLISDLISQEGKLKNKSAQQGLWQSNLPLNPGDSGGPILSKDGVVVGVAKAGLEYEETVDKPQMAAGISYIIPIRYADSLLRNAGVKEECPVAAPLAVENQVVTFSIDETKDDHPALSPTSRTYERAFAAPPGKTFVSASFEGARNNVSGPDILISADGRTLTVRFTLTSGPAFDRWRGWLSGTVNAKVR